MRIIVHIGAPKSGTTTLQRRLAANYEALLAEGVMYPVAGRNVGDNTISRQVGFRIAMTDPESTPTGMMLHNELKAGLTSPKDRREFSARFADAFDAEIEASRPEIVILSDEALFKFSDEATIGNCAHFLRSRFESIQVLCVLRDPINYVRSVYSQSVKKGRLTCVDSASDFQLWDEFKTGFYLERLRAWARHFSPEEMEVRPHSNDIIGTAFPELAKLGLLHPDQKSNQSLTSTGIAYLGEMNHRFQSARPAIIRSAFEKTMSGKPFSLGPEIEASILETFASERNAIVEEFVRRPEDRKKILEDWAPEAPSPDPGNPEEPLNAEICDMIEFLAKQNEKSRERAIKLQNQLDKKEAKISRLQAKVDKLEKSLLNRLWR